MKRFALGALLALSTPLGPAPRAEPAPQPCLDYCGWRERCSYFVVDHHKNVFCFARSASPAFYPHRLLRLRETTNAEEPMTIGFDTDVNAAELGSILNTSTGWGVVFTEPMPAMFKSGVYTGTVIQIVSAIAATAGAESDVDASNATITFRRSSSSVTSTQSRDRR